MSVRDNVLRIRDNIDAACARAGRRSEEVTLIAVTKFVDEARIAEAIAAGITDVGENRVQEWQSKYDFFTAQGINMHLIGQMQNNKVKYIIDKGVRLVQSLDRLALAREMENRCAAAGCTQDVLIEVNIGDETQKGGAPAAELRALLEDISALSHIRVQGLMCIPPAVGAEDARPYFARMRTLFESLSGEDLPGVRMRCLSMGMSGDYTVAIEEGATMVRVGTAMFGARY